MPQQAGRWHRRTRRLPGSSRCCKGAWHVGAECDGGLSLPDCAEPVARSPANALHGGLGNHIVRFMVSVRVCGLIMVAGAALAASVGPSQGSLVIVGGGQLTPEIIQRFIQLGGGREAPM